MKLLVKNTIVYGLLTIGGYLLMKYLTPFTIDWLEGFIISLLTISVFIIGLFGLFITYFVGRSHSDPI
jgi:hypothetical protein